jgi:hypothetical protein
MGVGYLCQSVRELSIIVEEGLFMNRILRLTFILFTFLIIFSTCFIYAVSAQTPIVLMCGESVESIITEDNQRQEYAVDAETGVRLLIYTEVRIGSYENLTIDMGLWAPNGFNIDGLQADLGFSDSPNATDTILTDNISIAGRYDLRVVGRTDTGGAYYLTVACIYETGEVISDTHVVQALRCGTILENAILRDFERHRYYIVLNRNDEFNVRATSLAGTYETLKLDMGLWAPNGFNIDGLQADLGFSDSPSETDSISTAALSVSGLYSLSVIGRTETTGSYDLSVSCILADGTVINPGDVPPVDLSAPTSEAVVAAPTTSFGGNGFPGLAPVDFTNVARIPMVAGTPMTGAITATGGEILGYALEGSAGDAVNFSFTRLSGNLNLGLVALSADNQVVFQASLVTSDTLTTQFVLPFEGQYTIGVFRIDLLPPAEPIPTAFQLQVDVTEGTAEAAEIVAATYRELNTVSRDSPITTASLSPPSTTSIRTIAPNPSTPTPITCPGVLPPRLVIGERGRVIPGIPNRLREEPGIDRTQIGRIDGGRQFDVLDGPVCSDGYAWWQVNYNGQVGWTAEGTNNEYWLEPLG